MNRLIAVYHRPFVKHNANANDNGGSSGVVWKTINGGHLLYNSILGKKIQ